jgi:hypothetical protein
VANIAALLLIPEESRYPKLGSHPNMATLPYYSLQLFSAGISADIRVLHCIALHSVILTCLMEDVRVYVG